MTNDFKAHRGIRFPQVTSMEHLADSLSPCYDAMIQKGDHLVLSRMNFKGENVAAIYEFIEYPEDGLSLIECRLNLTEVSEMTFLDNGSAIAWGLSKI